MEKKEESVSLDVIWDEEVHMWIWFFLLGVLWENHCARSLGGPEKELVREYLRPGMELGLWARIEWALGRRENRRKGAVGKGINCFPPVLQPDHKHSFPIRLFNGPLRWMRGSVPCQEWWYWGGQPWGSASPLLFIMSELKRELFGQAC